jgi:hypothetical protein
MVDPRGVIRLLGWTAVVVMAAFLALTPSAGASESGCSSPAGAAACAGLASAPFVTPAEARQAVTALWNTEERAHVTKNVALYNGIDTGTVLLEQLYALDDIKCGCSPFYWTRGVRTIRNLDIFLPQQTHYPLFFMAQVLAAPAGTSVPAGRTTSAIFVTRAAQDQPWRLAMEVWDSGYAAPGVALPPPVVDAAGYLSSAPGAQEVVAERWPAELAAYYNHIKVTGSPPATSPFLPGQLTTGTDLGQRRDGFVSGGIVNHYHFVASPLGGPWVFFDGQAMESCADIIEYQTLTWARPNTVFEQIDGTKPNWGPDLDTGFYSKIVTTWQRDVCISPNGGGLEVWGPESTSGYPIHDGGVPAKAGPGTTRVA